MRALIDFRSAQANAGVARATAGPATAARRFWVVVHRWAGLTIALFLCVAGLTGSLITWNHELELATAPGLHRAAPPTPGAAMLSPLTLRARAEALTGAHVDSLPLRVAPGETLKLYPTAKSGQSPLGYDQMFMNPYTGAEQGRRAMGDLDEGWHNIMPFIYRLHHELALGEWAGLAFGVAALIWTFDCFVGFYLTLPVAKGGGWRRWGKAWAVRTPVRNRYRLNVDLHTAGGLWLWPVLLVFAWSAVGLNLRDQVYDPVMTALTGKRDMFATMPRPAVAEARRMSWAQALATGRSHAAALAARHDFTIEREGHLIFQRAAGLARYQVRSDRDINDEYGATRILFRDSDGGLFNYQVPTGHHLRETIDSWTFGLHMARVWGLPYRIFVTLLGLATTGLAVTGVVIWMRKRSARLLGMRRRAMTAVAG